MPATAAGLGVVLPAGAGVIPENFGDMQNTLRAPRRRGGDPSICFNLSEPSVCSPQARG